MRYLFVVMMLLVPLAPAQAQLSVQFGIPSVSIGFNQGYYPRMVAVPGLPVYYDPGADSNYFFYDGMYWVYERDSWYASAWYNGPWSQVDRQGVPLYLLRVPVGYYRNRPAYFRGWQRDAPPRWGQYWGRGWEQQHRGWDRWDRRGVPAAAPLPDYQRDYAGHRYPQAEQQHALRSENYRHDHRDDAVRRTYQAQYQRGEPAHTQRVEPNRPSQQMQPMQKGRGPEQDRMHQDRAGEPRPRQDADRQRGREQGPGQPRGEERRPEHDR
jgi:hypothetical protein